MLYNTLRSEQDFQTYILEMRAIILGMQWIKMWIRFENMGHTAGEAPGSLTTYNYTCTYTVRFESDLNTTSFKTDSSLNYNSSLIEVWISEKEGISD